MKLNNKLFVSRADRRGFILLLIVILICIGITSLWKYHYNQKVKVLSESEIQELTNFDSATHTKEQYFSPISFDPNTADSVTLIKCGLTPQQAHNTLQYRRKGGTWRDKEHFSHLYGLCSKDFKRIEPYIEIVPQYTRKSKFKKNSTQIVLPYTEKLAVGSKIDINNADTTSLKKIPGIGSYYASKIFKYRERLGGFVNIKQVKEIEGIPEDIENWIYITEDPHIKTIKINKASFKELIRHPYLNYEQVKAITQHIHNYGKINSWNELKFYKEFNEEDFLKLSPYFIF